MDPRLAEQIAFELKREAPGEVAWMEAGSRILYARYDGPAKAPRSAIVDLIQGVYDHDPRMARKLLRARIQSTAPATEMCLGMVRVSAKRLEAPVAPIDHGLIAPQERLLLLPGPTPALLEPQACLLDESSLMERALSLKDLVARQEFRYRSDRPIAALLVSREGEILAQALNANADNRTRHAEVNLIQAYYGRTGRLLPRGARLFVTLKSCKMCAAMIWHCSENVRELEVVYAEEDPGPHGARTVLNPGTHERIRASQGAEELVLAIERRFAPNG